MPNRQSFDACVIGASPAGVAAALELAACGLTVALVESGSENEDSAAQRLSDATINTTESHSLMAEAVRRGLGGISALWGARCVPLDALDFEPGDFIPESGGPLKANDLQPDYQWACEILGVGDASFKVNACNSLVTKEYTSSSEFDDTDTLRGDTYIPCLANGQCNQSQGRVSLARCWKDGATGNVAV